MSEKILIVDDDIDSLKLIGLMLQRHGYEVTAANTGTQALTKASAEHPDLIILDVMMPDMDGYEVCRRLRSSKNTDDIPIIMFTAKTLVDDKVAGFEAGADDYLTKPTHPAELASRVKAILARSAGQKKPEEAAAVPRGTTIGVLGAKGGVGTSTIALNVAAALLMLGEEPVVADFRPGAGSLGLMLGQEQASGMGNILGKPPGEIQPAAIERELLVHNSNLRALVSSPKPRDAQIKYSLESALAVVNGLRTISHPAVIDLGTGYTEVVSQLQREMDQLILIVDPFAVTLAMARMLLRELDDVGTNSGRVHVVVVDRSHNLQVAWNEVETVIGREIRAVFSDSPELAHQAARTGTPMVMLQSNSIFANQVAKFSEDLNARIKTLVSGQLTH